MVDLLTKARRLAGLAAFVVGVPGAALAASPTATVQFESNPAGAVVMTNGSVLCQATPCVGAVPVGRTAVLMQKPRYLPRETILDVVPGMPPVSWTLQPSFGWLTVTSNPPGVAVQLNGKEIGTTPLVARELDPGAYVVQVNDPRYYDRREKFVLVRGQKMMLALKMLPRKDPAQTSARVSSRNDGGGEVRAANPADRKAAATGPAEAGGAAKPEERAPDPSPPAKAEARAAATIDAEGVKKVIREHLGRIKICYYEGLKENPDLKGDLVVQFTVGLDGYVTATRIASSTINSPEVENCVLRRFARMQFSPPQGGEVTIRYPLRFTE